MRQVLQIALVNLKSLPQRLASSFVVIVGIGGVVAVLISVLAMATGLTETMLRAGQAGRAVVLRNGALTESLSSLPREALLAIETAPGIRSGADGRPLVSPEVLVAVNLPRKGNAVDAAVQVRGLTESGFRVRRELELEAGRLFVPGRYEVIAGRGAREQFRDLEVGATVSFYNADWTVVGVFASNGDAHESELLTDAATLMPAAQRSVYNAATLELASVGSFDALKEALESNPRLKVQVKRETEYYEGRSEFVSRLLYFVAYVVGAIMALGALFGALNTMYSAVAARTVEIATLRALGFGATPIVVSVLVESLALALVGAIAGAAVAWVLFNGEAFSTGGNLGQVALELNVGLPLFVTGVVWACGIGLLGGLLPAIRAARLPVSVGLRVEA